MSIEFKLPAVGENVDTAEIGGLRVKVGDQIAADQVVMEIETDKAVFELPCPYSGKITKIHVKPGDTVRTDAVLLTIDGADGAAGKPESASSEPGREGKQPQGAPAPAAPPKEAAEEKAKPAPPRAPAKAPPAEA